MCLLLCSLFVSRPPNVFCGRLNSMLSILFQPRLNAAILRGYATVAKATANINVAASYLSEEFIDRVQRSRQQAQRSLVIEDRTHDQFIWMQSDEQINKQLLDESSIGIHRWKAGKLRFVLAEFQQEASLWHAIRCKFVFQGQSETFLNVFNLVLRIKHHLWVNSQVCFITDTNFRRTSLAKNQNQQEKRTIEMYNPSNPFEASYAIVNVQSPDNPHKIKFAFEDATLKGQVSTRTARRQSHQNIQAQQQLLMFDQLLAGEDLLSPLQMKLRFVILNQIEHLVREKTISFSIRNKPHLKAPKSMFKFQLLPFGSDISGFGSSDSDLDLCFVPAEQLGQKLSLPQGVRVLKNICDVLQTSSVRLDTAYLPHYHSLIRIYRAFVPIIKCRSRLLPNVNIDLSVDIVVNSGVTMAAYLYHCSHFDGRVRPFIMLLKSWSTFHQIVRSEPGDWFSSFQMTMLGIAFLQHRKILPTMEVWKRRQWRGEDKAVDGNNNRTATSKDEIVRMFGDFLAWTVSYDFWRCGLDIYAGDFSQPKPNDVSGSSCVYVRNPSVPALNITKKVTEPELERFLTLARMTMEVMERDNFNLLDIFLNMDAKCFNYHRP